VRAATKEYEALQKVIFPKRKIGLLHGRMKTKEKDKMLENFRRGKIDLLVATPVVEVGLDIPNATIMMIEAAERFGLAQLHQLRGRVGRGEKQSFCLLFTESGSSDVLQRLKHLETKNVGAELAEIDLKLRGPGEIYGTKQHGFLNLKIAKLTDASLIERTRREAKKLLNDSPGLSEFPLLNNVLKKLKIEELAPN
jgi:ATP-dependent DNA helicase RecG